MKTLKDHLNQSLKDKTFAKEWRKISPLYDIALAIIESRTKLKMNKSQLAQKAGITRSELSRVENLSANPTISTLNKITNAMNLKLKISFEQFDILLCEHMSINQSQELEDLSQQVKVCQKCQLCKTAIQAVPGEGSPDADLMFIGEAPGAEEDKQGRPFVGRSGKLLDFMIGQIGYSRDNVFIGNIIKHRPPSNRDPLPSEIEACKPFITKQIDIIQPKLIVTLGRFAMNYFLPDAKISESRGQVFEIGKLKIYPVYHPAAGLRNPKMKTSLITDFLRIPQVLEKL